MKPKNLLKTYSLSLIIMCLLFAFPYSLLSMALSSIISDFNLVGGSQGMMKSLTSIGALVALISILVLQHKIKKSKLLVVAVGLMIIALVALGVIQTYLLLLAFYFVLGMGVGYFDSTANSFIIDLNGEKSAPYLGAMQSFFGVGGLILPFFYRWVNTSLDWRGIHFVVAGIMVLAVFQFIIIGKLARADIEKVTVKTARFTKEDMKHFFCNRFNILLLLSMLFFSFLQTGNSLWVVRYVSTSLNAPELGAWAFSLFWVFSSISRILSPHLKLDLFAAFIWGSAISGIVMLWGVLMSSGIMMCIACSLFGVFGGPCIPSIILLGAKKYPEKTALPSSMLVMMLYIASTLIPLVMGAIAQISSLQTSMILPGVSGIIAGIIAVFARQTDKKHDFNNPIEISQ